MQGATSMLPCRVCALARGALRSASPMLSNNCVSLQPSPTWSKTAIHYKDSRRCLSGRGAIAAQAAAASTAVYDAPELYEAAFGYRDFPKEAAFLRDAYKVYCGNGAAAKSFVELGAGPAMHSVELARGGAVVYAVEQSAAMVEHARRKAAAAGVDLHLIQGDMETFLLPDGVLVDGASMLLGTMAHLLTNEAAVKCFHATAAALQPGGLFVLELASPDDLFDGAFALGDVWDAATADGQKLVVEYGTEGDDFDPISQVVQRSVKISTVRSDGGNDKLLLEECVAQRLYTYQEVDLLARLTGFQVVGVHGALDMQVGVNSEDSYALVICLRKQ